MAKITYCPNGVYPTKDKSGNYYYVHQEMTLDAFLDGIQMGSWRNQTEDFRSKKASGNYTKKQLGEIKNKIPNVLTSGWFLVPEDDKLIQHSGFIAVDIDHFNDDEKRKLIENDPYTFSCFVSVGGEGLCVIVPIDGSKHRESYNALMRYYETKYGIKKKDQTDPKAINPSRRRFCSYDPNCKINPDAIQFDLFEKPKAAPILPIAQNAEKEKFEKLLDWVQTNQVDLTNDYNDWLKIGMALLSGGYGENEFHIFSRYSSKYNATDCKKKWDQICKSGTKNVTIASLYWLAESAGFTLKKQAKQKQKANEPQSKPEGKPEATDLISRMESFVAAQGLEYNIIRDIYQFSNGKEFTDRDQNTLYLKCKKEVSPKVSRSDFNSAIESDIVPAFHPIMKWVESNKHIRLQGYEGSIIERLADTIEYTKKDESPLYVDWLRFFLKKWFVGFFENLYGGNCPLILVLCEHEGGKGKTEFFIRLLPDEIKDYCTASTLDHEPIRTMSQNWLIYDDEFGGKSKQESKTLKMLTSSKATRLRGAFHKRFSTYHRLAMLAGTSNEYEVISDMSTNNRRIIPVNVLNMNWEAYNKINKTELFMDAYRLYQKGFRSILDKKEVEWLNDNTSANSPMSSEFELVSRYVQKSDTIFLTTTEIKAVLEKDTNQRLSLRQVGLAMRKCGFDQTSKRFNNKIVRGYQVSIEHADLWRTTEPELVLPKISEDLF